MRQMTPLESSVLNGIVLHTARPSRPVAGRAPLLFVHGMLGGAWYWDRYQRFFADLGYESVALDLRGHHGSRSVADLGRVRIADYVDDVLEVARSLGSPVVIGHSMGGLIAQKVAEAGAARSLVLVCAAPPRGIPVASTTLVRTQVKYVGQMLRSRTLLGTRADHDALMFNRTPVADRAALSARLVPDSGTAGREISLGTVRVDESRVRCPVLSVVAEDDRFVVPRVGRRVAAKYHAALRVYSNHAHMIVGEPGWEGPAADVERWISLQLERDADPSAAERLWRQCKDAIGRRGEIVFFDGGRQQVEIVNVDLAERQNVVYELLEIRASGRAGPPRQGSRVAMSGDVISAAFSEIVAFTADAEFA